MFTSEEQDHDAARDLEAERLACEAALDDPWFGSGFELANYRNSLPLPAAVKNDLPF